VSRARIKIIETGMAAFSKMHTTAVVVVTTVYTSSVLTPGE